MVRLSLSISPSFFNLLLLVAAIRQSMLIIALSSSLYLCLTHTHTHTYTHTHTHTHTHTEESMAVVGLTKDILIICEAVAQNLKKDGLDGLSSRHTHKHMMKHTHTHTHTVKCTDTYVFTDGGWECCGSNSLACWTASSAHTPAPVNTHMHAHTCAFTHAETNELLTQRIGDYT